MRRVGAATVLRPLWSVVTMYAWTHVGGPSVAGVVTSEGIGRFVNDMPMHAVRLLAGTDVDGLSEAFAASDRPARPVVRLHAVDGTNGGAGGLPRRAVRDLGRVVSARWPYLWHDDLSDVRDDALGLAHLPLRLARLARRVPRMSAAWALEASVRMLRSHPPCPPTSSPALAWEQLVLAFSPSGLVLLVRAPERPPTAMLSALEWLAEGAPVSVLLLAPTMPPTGGAYDRALFGACRLVPPDETSAPRTMDAEVFADIEVDGRPHPGSVAERKLYELIRTDAELAPLFGFNLVVPEVTRAEARVDILWSAGRVAVEVDGHEHRRSAQYRADRHRDYELLRAGYRVLRLTNEEVAEDAGLALAKIRDVVRLSRNEGL